MAEEFRIDVVVDPRQVRRGTQAVDRQLRRIERSAARVGNTLRRTIGGLAGFLGGRELLRIADDVQTFENRLRIVSRTSAQVESSLERLFEISEKTRQSFDATSTVYTRVALSAEELGRTQAELLDFTERLNNAVLLSGVTAREARNGLIQLSQGLASNRLSGDELRSVLEQLPVVARTIARGLGVTRGELRKLGEQGELTANQILEAFDQAADELEAQVGEIPLTISQALTQLRNEITEFFASDAGRAVSRFVSDTIRTITDGVDAIGDRLNNLSVSSRDRERLILDEAGVGPDSPGRDRREALRQFRRGQQPGASAADRAFSQSVERRISLLERERRAVASVEDAIESLLELRSEGRTPEFGATSIVPQLEESIAASEAFNDVVRALRRNLELTDEQLRQVFGSLEGLDLPVSPEFVGPLEPGERRAAGPDEFRFLRRRGALRAAIEQRDIERDREDILRRRIQLGEVVAAQLEKESRLRQEALDFEASDLDTPIKLLRQIFAERQRIERSVPAARGVVTEEERAEAVRRLQDEREATLREQFAQGERQEAERKRRADALKDEAEAIRETVDARRDSIAAVEDEITALQQEIDLLGGTSETRNRIISQQILLNQARAQGVEDTQAFLQANEGLRQSLERTLDARDAAQARREFAEGIAREGAEIPLRGVLDPLNDALRSGDFEDIGRKIGASLAFAIADAASNVLRRTLATFLETFLTNLLLGGISPGPGPGVAPLGSGGAGGGGLGRPVPPELAGGGFATGGIFSRGRVVKRFQRGGILTQPATFPLGLAGEGDTPEAFLPLDRNFRAPMAGGGSLGLTRENGVLRIDGSGLGAGALETRQLQRQLDELQLAFASVSQRARSTAGTAGPRFTRQQDGERGDFVEEEGGSFRI